MTEDIIDILKQSKLNLTIFKNKFLKYSEDPNNFSVSDNVDKLLARLDKIFYTSPKATIGVKIEDVMYCVCSHYNIPIERLQSKSHSQLDVVPRQMVMYITKEFLKVNYSLVEIGAHLGGKCHATVLYGIKTIKNNIDTDLRKKQDFELIKHMIESLYNNGRVL